MISNRKFQILVGSVSVASAVAVFSIGGCSNDSANAKPNLVFKDPPTAEAVAKIGEETINMDQLVGDQKIQYLEIKKREYEFKMERLKAIMTEKLIAQEAKKENMSVEDYTNKKVLKGEIKVTDQEYDKFVKEKKIPENQINPQIKERIKAYLVEQKKDNLIQQLLAKLTKKSPVEVYFKKPKSDIQVDIASAPVSGPEKAPVTIVEFSDFQCPFCARAAETMGQIRDKYKGKVKFAYKHFPLSFHKEAMPAAEAAMCVYDQDKEKFWKFHEAAFKGQKDGLAAANLEKWAKESGANVDKYKECVAANKYKEAIEKDLAYGETLGVRSTPTFFINGEIVSGALEYDKFAEIIDEAIEDAKQASN